MISRGFHYIIILIIGLFLFSSCQEEVDISINSSSDQLVVEGFIQQGHPAYVFLTTTESYFSPIDSNTISDIVIDDANIYIEREDGIVHQLTYLNQNLIDSLSFLFDSLELYVPGIYIDLSYQEDDFSQIGYKYKLIIESNTDTLTAITSIPPQFPVDSLWVQRKDSLVNDYKCYIWASVTDPDTTGNCVGIHFKRDKHFGPMDPLFIPCALTYRTDVIGNGESFPTYFARSGRPDDEDGVFLPFHADRIIDGKERRRDIVLLRVSHMDKNTYNFWRGVERSEGASGNPFAEPMNLMSNINGGLGVWGGYGVSYYYIPIVPDTVIYDNYTDVEVWEIF